MSVRSHGIQGHPSFCQNSSATLLVKLSCLIRNIMVAKQGGWRWLQMESSSKLLSLPSYFWPLICSWYLTLESSVFMLLKRWSDCIARGLWSLITLGIAALFVILWSFFLCLTSTLCLFYALLLLSVTWATIWHLGPTSGLSLIGLLGVLAHWTFGNLVMIAGSLIIGGYMFCRSNARIVIFIASAYSIYAVYVRVGWNGIILLTSLSFLSNDLLTIFLQRCDRAHDNSQWEEPRKSEPVSGDIPEKDDTFSPESVQAEDDLHQPLKESDAGTNKNDENFSLSNEAIKPDSSSADEMRRIMESSSHYEALGFPRYKSIDGAVLKREYKRKAVLVHPDKNIGNHLASDSFKRLQSAYEVLSDMTKRRAYDEKLRKEELSIVPHKNQGSVNEARDGFGCEKSRHIKCILCSRIHVWTRTNRSTGRARWCQECHQYHPARDGEGWVEKGLSRSTSGIKKLETPRAFVCAEDKIFDVTEWAACQMQGVTCKVNSHQATFRAKILGPDLRASSDESGVSSLQPNARTRTTVAPMVMMAAPPEMVKTSELSRLKQVFSSGRLSDAHQIRKTWTPFKINPRSGLIRQLRRYSLG